MEEEVKEQIDRAFTKSPPPTDTQCERYDLICSTARSFAEMIATFCPPSRERSLALTSVEQSMMWAIASIARNG
jgi:hypothetical protein